MSASFWRGRRVFLTGHTGFKGSWLTQWLKMDGAAVTGYSLAPPTHPSLYESAKVSEGIRAIEGDVRNLDALAAAVAEAQPEIVIHLAGQPLVRHSYQDPVATYATNVMGTVHLLEAVRRRPDVRVVLVVTSDKCYEDSNGHAGRAFREGDVLGGHDPYASSKACAELVAVAYRRSFFGAPGGTRVMTARAGNVIGGGDWAGDRLVPDLVRAFAEGRAASIRNPDATRPWQHVLDALHGYRKVVEAAFDRDDLPDAWNFGAREALPVRWLADRMTALWGAPAAWHPEGGPHPAEAPALALDSSRAGAELGWNPLVDPETTVQWTALWYQRWLRNESARALTGEQIERFAERL